MRVASTVQVEVKVHAGFVTERLHEIVDENRLEGADAVFFNRNIISEIAASAEVYDRSAKGFVEWHRSLTEAADTAAIAKCLFEGAAEDDANILHGVVVIDMQVAGSLDLEIEEAVTGEALEHMVKKRDAGADFTAARSVETKRDRDRGFAGLALDFGEAGGRSRPVAGGEPR